MHTRFSQRLNWRHTENALSASESSRRRAGLPVWDLTESNPTTIGLPDSVPDDPGAPEPLSKSLHQIARLPYTPTPRGLPHARKAIAATYDASGSSVDPDRIVLTASSSESYGFLWKLLCDPGDAVLVPEPSYPLFEYLARLDGVTPISYRLTHDGTRSGDWHLDLESVDHALATAPAPVGALVVVSPNNPTGSVLTADDLAALDQRAAEGGFALIADEVFADYVVDAPPRYVPCLAARSTAALTFSLGGLSKSCGLPHLKLGWIAVGGPPALASTALDRLDLIADTYLSVATPVQAALPELLRFGAIRRQAISARIAQNRAFLAQALAPPSPLSVLKSGGGWSAIVRVPAVNSDEGWARILLEQDGVLVQPGYFFDLSPWTCVVVSLLPPPELFQEAIVKIAARARSLLG